MKDCVLTVVAAISGFIKKIEMTGSGYHWRIK